MSNLDEVLELLEQMYEDRSIPKNVRGILTKARNILKDNSKEIGMRVDAAVQEIEGLSLDFNISAYTREQIWNLTSLLSSMSK